MSHLHQEIQRHPANVSVAGVLQGVISKAPGGAGKAAGVVLRAMSSAGLVTQPTLQAMIAVGTPEFPTALWEPHPGANPGDAQTFPAVGNLCLVVFDDTGVPWIIAWWPHPFPS
jgi:hypothetical protein